MVEPACASSNGKNRTFRCSTIRTFRCSTDKDPLGGSTVKDPLGGSTDKERRGEEMNDFPF